MSSSTHPRVSLELQHLILDFLTETRRDGEKWTSTYRHQLAQCALVDKSWNTRATRRLWKSIYLDLDDEPEAHKIACGLLSAIMSNPGLAAHVQNLFLRMDVDEGHREYQRPKYGRRPDFLALCQFLPAPVELTLHHEYLSDDDGRPTAGNHHPTEMAILLAPLCSSTVLTTFTFSGEILPFGLLMSAPNLRHLTLHDVVLSTLPRLEDGSTAKLPFRLKSARFSGSQEAIATLSTTNIQVFSELQSLKVTPYITPEDYVHIAPILSISSGMSKEIVLPHGGARFLKAYMGQDHRSLDWLLNLRRLSIDFTLREVPDARWAVLDILEDIRTPLSCLERLEFKLKCVSIQEFKAFCDPTNRGWQLARRLLSPESAPLLQHLAIHISWSYYFETDDQTSDSDPSTAIRNGMREAFQIAFGTCFPIQAHDKRDVRIIFNAEYRDPENDDDDVYYDDE